MSTKCAVREETKPDILRKWVIQIISGHNLAKMDVFGKSDPYCKVFIGDKAQQTGTQKNTFDPIWNESLSFYQCVQKSEETATVKFEVFDADRFDDDFMGQNEIKLVFDENLRAMLRGTDEKQEEKGDEIEIELKLQPKKRNKKNPKISGHIKIVIKCECVTATPINPATDARTMLFDQSYKDNSIFKVFETRANINWICDNIQDLAEIAGKIKKKEHKWSINDFNNVDAPSDNLGERFTDYYLQYTRYVAANTHRVVTLSGQSFEVKYDDIAKNKYDFMFDEHLTDITDALWVMFRQYFILNVLMHGQEEEFNIFRSYYFTSGTNAKETCNTIGGAIFHSSAAQQKLALSFLSILLQVSLTTAIVYQVVMDWDLDSIFDDTEIIIFICSVFIFIYLSFVTDATIRKCTTFYENIGAICIVPWYCIIGDFIVNVLVPITICCVSLFFLLHSETLGDLVLNSFALTFVYQLDDDINVFENDEDYILREDINLFLKQKKSCNDLEGLKNNRRHIHIVESGFMRLFISPFFFISNFWHCLKFINVAFIKKIPRGDGVGGCCNSGDGEIGYKSVPSFNKANVDD